MDEDAWEELEKTIRQAETGLSRPDSWWMILLMRMRDSLHLHLDIIYASFPISFAGHKHSCSRSHHWRFVFPYSSQLTHVSVLLAVDCRRRSRTEVHLSMWNWWKILDVRSSSSPEVNKVWPPFTSRPPSANALPSWYLSLVVPWR